MQAHTKDFSDISYSCHLQEEQCLPPCHEKVPLTIDISFNILSYVFACQATVWIEIYALFSYKHRLGDGN